MPILAKVIMLGTMLLSAGACFLPAYLIAVKQITGLISGYKKGTAHDEPGLTRFLGKWLNVMGIAMVLMGIAVVFLTDSTAVWIWTGVLLAVTVAISIVLVAGQSRYAKPRESQPLA